MSVLEQVDDAQVIHMQPRPHLVTHAEQQCRRAARVKESRVAIESPVPENIGPYLADLDLQFVKASSGDAVGRGDCAPHAVARPGPTFR